MGGRDLRIDLATVRQEDRLAGVNWRDAPKVQQQKFQGGGFGSRGGYGDRGRGGFGGDREDRGRYGGDRGGPREYQPLNIAPRSASNATDRGAAPAPAPAKSTRRSNPFGDAKPVDTMKKELAIEERLLAAAPKKETPTPPSGE